MLRQEWKKESGGTPYRFRTIQPEIREKVNGSRTIRLTRSNELTDYPAECVVVSKKGSMARNVGRAGWVDWHQQGRLVFVKDGRTFKGDINADGSITERQLLDLNSSKPRPLVPPHWATTW